MVAKTRRDEGNGNVGSYPAPTDIQPTRLSRFVRVSLQTGQPPEVEATGAAERPSSPLDRLGYGLKRILLGPATAVEDCRHDRPVPPAKLRGTPSELCYNLE